MKIKQWEQLESIFHAALGLSGKQRRLYLSEACSDDELLLKEVNSLISAFEEESRFLDQPAFSLGLTVLQHTAKENLAGQKISYYQIKERLGGGGMGEVYLAEDTRLNRMVALKFLKTTLLDNEWAKRQFIREAQAAAMLQHQNICTVHSIEEVDEHNFIVMQHIEGKTLARYIDDSQINTANIVQIARQIVSALAVAHSHGIIHRDMKPGNIMIMPDGQVKVLDFGLAKVIQQKQKSDHEEDNASQISNNGLILGTVSYMSPEQLRAEKLDYRSDIFSVGIVLFELINKQNPFNCKSQAETIAAILDNGNAPFIGKSFQVPDALTTIVEKCLNKDKSKRFQSAVELLVELDNLKNDTKVNSSSRNATRLRGYAVMTMLFLMVASIFFYYTYSNNKVSSFAVLPITNQSNDSNNDYLSDGLTENLISRLSRVKRLRVKATTIVSRYKGRGDIDPQQAGKELGVENVLVGKIIRRENAVLLAASLVKTSDGSQIWSKEYYIEGNDLEISQNELAIQIISKLEVSLPKDENQLLTKQPLINAEARRQYFLGRYFWNKRDQENIQKAIEHFNKAIEIEPSYAQAWSGLADSYIVMSTPAYGSLEVKKAIDKSKSALLKALELDESLCEAYTSLGSIKLRYEWDWSSAEENFLKAIELNPDYAQAHYAYSSLLVLKRQFAKAMLEAEKAKELDPLFPMSNLNIGRVFYYNRQNDKAIQVFTEFFNNNPTNKTAAYMLSLAYIQNGDFDKAISILQRFYDTDKEYFAAPLGYAYGKTGRKDDALKIINELEQRSKEKHIPPQEEAIIYLGLDDKDKAFERLNQSCAERFPAFPLLLTDSLVDGINSDPRFAELKKCVKPLE